MKQEKNYVGIRGYLVNINESDQEVINHKSAIKNHLEELYNRGYRTFLIGLQYGYEIVSAESLLEIKTTYGQDLKIKAVIPYEEEANYWKEFWRERYFNILAECDEVVVLHSKFRAGCYHEKNAYIEKNSDLMFYYFDGNIYMKETSVV